MLSTYAHQAMHDPRTALLLSNKGRWQGALCVSTAVVLKMTDCPRHFRSKNEMA